MNPHLLDHVVDEVFRLAQIQESGWIYNPVLVKTLAESETEIAKKKDVNQKLPEVKEKPATGLQAGKDLPENKKGVNKEKKKDNEKKTTRSKKHKKKKNKSSKKSSSGSADDDWSDSSSHADDSSL